MSWLRRLATMRVTKYPKDQYFVSLCYFRFYDYSKIEIKRNEITV